MKPKFYFPNVLVVPILLSVAISCLFSCNQISDAVGQNRFSGQVTEVEITDSRKEDVQFLINTAETSLENIELGQLTIRCAMVLEVKELGKMISDGQTRHFEGLKKLADKKKVTIPLSLTNDSQVVYEKLSVESMYDYDQKYCDRMVSGHLKTIHAFEERIRETTDIDIKVWAESTLPNLKMNLEHAVICQKNLEPLASTN